MELSLSIECDFKWHTLNQAKNISENCFLERAGLLITWKEINSYCPGISEHISIENFDISYKKLWKKKKLIVTQHNLFIYYKICKRSATVVDFLRKCHLKKGKKKNCDSTYVDIFRQSFLRLEPYTEK